MTTTQKRGRGRPRSPIPASRHIHHDVAALDHRTTELGIPSTAIAAHIGVAPTTVDAWRRGIHSPHFREMCMWAELVGLRVAVKLGADVLAEGIAVASGLRKLRTDRGISSARMAVIRCIPATAVTAFERDAPQTARLGTIDAHITALGLRLTVLRGSDA